MPEQLLSNLNVQFGKGMAWISAALPCRRRDEKTKITGCNFQTIHFSLLNTFFHHHHCNIASASSVITFIVIKVTFVLSKWQGMTWTNNGWMDGQR